MKNVIIIGAGQLGSRHLQSLKSVNVPLAITVVDPNPESLKVAQERYESIPNGTAQHTLHFSQKVEINQNGYDVAINASNADVRLAVIKELLEKNKVQYAIIEKILFNKKEDYFTAKELLEKSGTKAWVNCTMRQASFYKSIKKDFENKKIFYRVTGSLYGLATNIIHFTDHMVHYTGCNEFKVNTQYLDKTIIPSKRKGFLEMTGTLIVEFANGSIGCFYCSNAGSMPIQVEIFADDIRCISRESEGRAWISKASDNWNWVEKDSKIEFQSQMTKNLVEDIFETGTCSLVPIKESMHTHVQLFDPILDFLKNNYDKNIDFYPFT